MIKTVNLLRVFSKQYFKIATTISAILVAFILMKNFSKVLTNVLMSGCLGYCNAFLFEMVKSDPQS